ncbi:MAG: N,N-dimethylformamidase beta subunit family domain-containing protein [Pseudomonadota bacterium]
MIGAYCWPQSLVAGESTQLFCHAQTSRAHLEVVRVGVEQTTVVSRQIQVFEQPLDADLASVGCRWRESLEIQVGREWTAGFYLVRIGSLVDDAIAETCEAFFVVRAQQPRSMLLVLSTSTWSAYNDWGGSSFYTGGHTSALQRPLPAGFLYKTDPARFRVAHVIDWSKSDARAFAQLGYSQWCMAAGWANWEQLFVAWAEAAGYTLGFATSLDLHADPNLLDGYKTYLSVGHDEYWSYAMRDHVEQFVDAGGNAAFFSGNTAFWQARFENQNTQLVSYKMAIEEDPYYQSGQGEYVSSMWSDPLVGRSENQMTGVSFIRGGYAHMPNSPRGSGGYALAQNDHWVFDGVQLNPDEDLGMNSTVVGYECDGCPLEDRDGLPFVVEPLLPEVPAPTGFEILATAPARLWETHQLAVGLRDDYVGELNWVAQRMQGEDSVANRAIYDQGHAVMGYFRRGQGRVFTTGCTDWAYGLADPNVVKVTHNVLDTFNKR